MVVSKSCFTYVTDFGWIGDLDQVAIPPLLTLMLQCAVVILILMEESLCKYTGSPKGACVWSRVPTGTQTTLGSTVSGHL